MTANAVLVLWARISLLLGPSLRLIGETNLLLTISTQFV